MRRGLDAVQARREACATLGGTPLRVREEIQDVRRLGRLDDLRRDVRHAVRLLRRDPALTLVVVSTLAVAIGATVAAFSNGLVAQAVAARMREIAIRLALGAHPRALMASFVRRALAAGVAGLALGALMAVTLARAHESLLYGAGDAASLLVAGVLLLAVVVIAAWIPARRAVRAGWWMVDGG